jgi:hypothetical protein
MMTIGGNDSSTEHGNDKNEFGAESRPMTADAGGSNKPSRVDSNLTASWVAAIASWVAAIASVAAAIVLSFTLKAAIYAGSEAKRLADLTREQADLTRDQLTLTLPPKLLVKNVAIWPEGASQYEHFDLSAKCKGCAIDGQFNIVNLGREKVSINDEFRCMTDWRKDPLPMLPPYYELRTPAALR